MKASELAARLNYDMIGEDHALIGISYCKEAKPNELAVVRHKAEMAVTQSDVLLTLPVLVNTKKTLLISYDNIETAIIRVCQVFMEEGILADYRLPAHLNRTGTGAFIGENVKVSQSAEIYPGAVIGNRVSIGKHCVIEPFAVIGSGTVIADNVFIGSGSKIGAESFYHSCDKFEGFLHFTGCGRTWIGEGTHIGSHTVIQRGTISDTVIGSHCMIGNNIDIGHDVRIGNYCKIVSQSGIAGNAVLGNHVEIYGQAGIANDVVIGNGVVVKAKTVVSRTVEDCQVVFGRFGRNYKDELRLAAKIRHYFSRKDV